MDRLSSIAVINRWLEGRVVESTGVDGLVFASWLELDIGPAFSDARLSISRNRSMLRADADARVSSA